MSARHGLATWPASLKNCSPPVFSSATQRVCWIPDSMSSRPINPSPKLMWTIYGALRRRGVSMVLSAAKWTKYFCRISITLKRRLTQPTPRILSYSWNLWAATFIIAKTSWANWQVAFMRGLSLSLCSIVLLIVAAKARLPSRLFWMGSRKISEPGTAPSYKIQSLR